VPDELAVVAGGDRAEREVQERDGGLCGARRRLTQFGTQAAPFGAG
jgi:hypothetical protein